MLRIKFIFQEKCSKIINCKNVKINKNKRAQNSTSSNSGCIRESGKMSKNGIQNYKYIHCRV